jgi:hypothetical protein
VPVVIELKRDRHKLHLLQALSYAAMVWTWDEDMLKTIAGQDADDDLINSIENRSDDASPRIVLIAADYDPEVILTADWLSAQHGVDIYCFSLWMQKHGDDRLVRFQLDYPLRELQDVYRIRQRVRAAAASAPSGQTWEDVKQWIDFDWGNWFIDLCRQVKEGQPQRRRFTAMFPDEWVRTIPISRKTASRSTSSAAGRETSNTGTRSCHPPASPRGEVTTPELRVFPSSSSHAKRQKPSSRP